MTVKLTGNRKQGQNDHDYTVYGLVAICECGEELTLSRFENRCGACGKWYDFTGAEFEKTNKKEAGK